MKDFLDNELNIGDEVVFIRPKYRELITGKIIRFTPKFCIIEKKSEYTSPSDAIKQTPCQLVKINK